MIIKVFEDSSIRISCINSTEYYQIQKNLKRILGPINISLQGTTEVENIIFKLDHKNISDLLYALLNS